MSKQIDVDVSGPNIDKIIYSLLRKRDFPKSCKEYCKDGEKIEFVVNQTLKFLACVDSIKRDGSSGYHWIIEGCLFGSNFRHFILNYNSGINKGRMVLSRK